MKKEGEKTHEALTCQIRRLELIVDEMRDLRGSLEQAAYTVSGLGMILSLLDQTLERTITLKSDLTTQLYDQNLEDFLNEFEFFEPSESQPRKRMRRD